MKLDPTVSKIKKGWYKDVSWQHYDVEGVIGKHLMVFILFVTAAI